MIGDAKKKLQRTINIAEELYEKVNELTRRVEDTTETVDDTNARVQELEGELADRQERLETKLDEERASLEAKVDEQRAVFRAELAAQREILEALADERGIDVGDLAEGTATPDDPTPTETAGEASTAEVADNDVPPGTAEGPPSDTAEEEADESVA
jgi:predicted nuclease with TOPRIM domain